MIDKIVTPRIIPLNIIQSVLPQIDLFKAISEGFIAWSKGEAVIPPVGELLFDSPPGDVHIKYGYIRSQPYYVVKIASGFYENPKHGISSSQGLNLLFDKNTGVLCAVLLDEGFLTNVRTAVAGAVATRALAAPSAKRIGIIGAGIQGRMQLEYHKKIMKVEEVLYWDRDIPAAKSLVDKMQRSDCQVTLASGPEEICRNCQVILTTTPATSFIIKNEWIEAGTHITAIGADTSEKTELDPILVDRADVVVTDSLSQSQSRGEVYKATEAGYLRDRKPVELGSLLSGDCPGRENSSQITIVDLTGVAVQDLMISQYVYEKVKS